MKSWNEVVAGDNIVYIYSDSRSYGKVTSVISSNSPNKNNKIYIIWDMYDAPMDYILNDNTDGGNYWAQFMHQYSNEQELLFLNIKYGT